MEVESKVWFSEFIPDSMLSNTDLLLVTGASSGFGRLLTEYLLQQGCKVIATLRKPEVLSDLVSQYPSTHLVVVKLDVTDHAEILQRFPKLRRHFAV